MLLNRQKAKGQRLKAKVPGTEASAFGIQPSAFRLLIVDGHAYAYRAFHAIRGMRAPLRPSPPSEDTRLGEGGGREGGEGDTRLGEPTGAIFGFIKMLAKLRQKAEGQRLKAEGPANEVLEFSLQPSAFRSGPSALTVVVWDGGLSAERLATLPEYKAQRPEMPSDLASQIDGMVSYLQAAGVASVCQDGVEADDLIAGLAQRGAEAGWDVVIASSDKDFMQLVSEGESKGQSLKAKGSEAEVLASSLQPSALPPSAPGRIGLLNPNDKSESVWGAEQVRNKTGVEPSQIVDWLALVGDSVDNIPGVPGVGPKTAAELLGQFGSVEGIYRRLSEVKSERLRGALQNSAEVVRRNQGLVRLKVDLPYEFSLEDFRARPGDAERLAELYRRWGFRSLLAEVEGKGAKAAGSGQRMLEQVVLI